MYNFRNVKVQAPNIQNSNTIEYTKLNLSIVFQIYLMHLCYLVSTASCILKKTRGGMTHTLNERETRSTKIFPLNLYFF